jgi:hypothetical protein
VGDTFDVEKIDNIVLDFDMRDFVGLGIHQKLYLTSPAFRRTISAA